MMICKIADFVFKIHSPCEESTGLYKKFLVNGDVPIDFEITVDDNDCRYEQSFIENQKNTGKERRACSSLALFRKICAYALENNAFMMHGALIEYEGKGYLFTAKSGTGKTTHIRRWKKLFGEDKVTVVNGDKPIIRFIDGKVYAYGTPWNGKEHYGTNGKVELSAICFVERDEENSIKKISDFEALPRIFSQIMIHDSTDLAKQMEYVDKLLQKVPTYLLKCNMDVSAAKVAYEGMNGENK